MRKIIIVSIVIVLLPFSISSCKPDYSYLDTETGKNTESIQVNSIDTYPEDTEDVSIYGVEIFEYPNPLLVSEYSILTYEQKVAYNVLSEALCDTLEKGPTPGKRYEFPVRVSWFDYQLAFNIIKANFSAIDVFFNYITSADSLGTQDYVDYIFLSNHDQLNEDYKMYLEMVDVADRILGSLQHSGNDYDKAFAIANWFVENVTFSESTDLSNTCYGALVKKEAVCDGYAKAYDFLCKKAGLYTIYVSSWYEMHAWNMIRINNSWYHIDVSRMTKKNIYSSFMMPDQIIQSKAYRDGFYYWNQETNEYIIPIADSFDLYKDYYKDCEDALSHFESIELSEEIEMYIAFDNYEEGNAFLQKNGYCITDVTGKKYIITAMNYSGLIYVVRFINIDKYTIK